PGRFLISARMLEYIRSHTRGGERKNVGRALRNSWGSLESPSENHTQEPVRRGINSATTRCAICAEGRKATVHSSAVSGRNAGVMSILITSAACVTKPILGSPVAPEVM